MAKKGLGMVNVCIPTLNAVDDFWKCVESLQNSSVECKIYVIDNGGFVEKRYENMLIHRPVSNLGVAGSWNYFIDHIPETRVITNDDIIFDKDALKYLMEFYSEDNLVVPENLNSAFSCYLLPQNVINKVGKFDEWISPRYAYFEDNDYSYRMSMQNIGIVRAVGSLVEHVGSSTLKHFDKQKEREHHDKFRFAREHYKQKWGGEPGQEKFTTPFNR